MAFYTIAASQLSRNEISSLAQIFETSLQYFHDHSSLFAEDYLKELSTIAGLGFTAVLVDKTFISMYQERLGTFIRYSDFRESGGSIPLLSLHIAEMIDMTCRLSYQMNKTDYVHAFCVSLKKVLSHISLIMEGKSDMVQSLLQKLICKREFF